MKTNQINNQQIGDMLDRIADLLEIQDANPHRVRAYRNGANRVRDSDQSIAEMVWNADGKALQDLPDIGVGLARVITQYVHAGRSDILDRLRGEISPAKLFSQIPTIGKKLSKRIANQLDVNSLEELEQAAHDGRLSEVAGFGSKRVENVRVSLAGMLSQAAQRRALRRARGDQKSDAEAQPGVAVLLDIDAEYRRKAEEDQLTKITPRRFNPDGKAWLPILHTSREGWDFTVLFSNTARAHQLGRTHDWVVIYFERDGREDQATVVTATHGPLEGKRVVRGREADCERYYRQRKPTR
jgi:hypothetical protein